MARSTDPIKAAHRALRELEAFARLYRSIPMEISHPAMTLAAMHVEHARSDLMYMLERQPEMKKAA